MLYPSLRPMVSLLQEENCCILENLGEILNGTAGVEPKVFCWFTLTQHNLDPSVQNFGLCQWDKWYKIAILFGKMLDVFALAMSWCVCGCMELWQQLLKSSPYDCSGKNNIEM